MHPALEVLSSADSKWEFTWKRFAELGWQRFQLYILARSLDYVKVYRAAQEEQRDAVLISFPRPYKKTQNSFMKTAFIHYKNMGAYSTDVLK